MNNLFVACLTGRLDDPEHPLARRVQQYNAVCRDAVAFLTGGKDTGDFLALIQAIITYGSQWNPFFAEDSRCGLMQLTPEMWLEAANGMKQHYRNKLTIQLLHPYDPVGNIYVGAYRLKRLLLLDTLENVLAAYRTSYRQVKMLQVLQLAPAREYVDGVLQIYQQLKLDATNNFNRAMLEPELIGSDFCALI